MVRVTGARLNPMDAREIVEGLALTARAAARTLVATTGEQRRQALLAIADEIDARTDEIIAANTQAIMSAISSLLPAGSREERTPTDDELRATFPASYSGDLRVDTTRRPGTD